MERDGSHGRGRVAWEAVRLFIYREETMKMLVTVIFLVAFLLVGCASPYQRQAYLLVQQYQNGEISDKEFQARLNKLEALDLQCRALVAQLMMVNHPNTSFLYNR